MSKPITLPMPEKRKFFEADAPWKARAAASAWLADFSEHGPLDIVSIRVTDDRSAFVAVVTYAEMMVEDSPRHFDEYVPLLKSA